MDARTHPGLQALVALQDLQAATVRALIDELPPAAAARAAARVAQAASEADFGGSEAADEVASIWLASVLRALNARAERR